MADDQPSVGGEESTDLSSMSPFKVLQHRQQTAASAAVVPPIPANPTPAPVTPPPAAPAPVVLPPVQAAATPVAPQPTREELLKQAAEAPATAFILPAAETLSQPTLPPTPVVPPIPANPTPAPVTPPPAAPAPVVLPRVAPTTPPAPLVRPLAGTAPTSVPPRVVPPLSAPVATPLRGASVPPPLGAKPVAAAVPLAKTASPGIPIAGRKAVRKNYAAIIAIVVVVLLLGSIGGLFLAAKKGSKVPFLYTSLTGLPTTGSGVANLALSYVQAHTTYQFTGTASVILASKDAASTSTPSPSPSGSTAPTLPSTNGTTSSSNQAGAVYAISTTLNSAGYVGGDTEYLGREDVVINKNNSLTLALHTGTKSAVTSLTLAAGSAPVDTSSSQWTYFVPTSSANPVVTQVADNDMQQTLLYPALKAIPVDVLLKSMGAETQYQQETSGQVAYAYQVQTNSLANFFPQQASLSNFEIIALYAPKSQGTAGTPIQIGLKGSMTYLGQAYDVVLDYTYSNWGTAPDTSGAPLSKVASSDGATPKGASDMAQQLGILSIAALPNTLPAASLVPPTIAVAPTGLTVTTAGAAITTTPPVPVSPAPADAVARDTQRLKDLQDLKTALTAYQKDNGTYPVADTPVQTGASSSLIAALVPKYLTAMPVDPVTGTYWYTYSSGGNSFQLTAIAEDSTNLEALHGSVYYYFEVTN